MLDAKTCDKRAAELRRFASVATSEVTRTRFLEMARLYEELAAQLRKAESDVEN